MEQEDFWKNQNSSKKVISEINQNKKLIEKYNELSNSIAILNDELNNEDSLLDFDYLLLLEEEFNKISKDFSSFEIETLLSGQYDHNNVLIEFHPGAGGTEAQDWAQMLFNMYVKYAEKKGYKTEILDFQLGNEAGIKSASLAISGENAYGYLKGETGVHRLVRISPFDSNSRRHTSFAAVEVLPEISDDISIDIRQEDIEMDVYRASGAGRTACKQNIFCCKNKTHS